MFTTPPALRSLFVVMLLVLVGFRLGLVDRAFRMLGRRVQRVQAHRLAVGGVDHVVLGAGRDDDGDAVRQRMLLAVEDGDALAGFDADELVVAGVVLEADLFAGLQGHDDQLAARRGVEHFTEIVPG